jgi:hypothetical protein
MAATPGSVLADLRLATEVEGELRGQPATERLSVKPQGGGAPADFAYHTMRHTVTTFLQNHGVDEWSRGLILNHAGSGSVTRLSAATQA